jgi:FkbM family methyltransferase
VPEDGHILNNIKKYSVWAGEEVSFLTSRYREILLKHPEEMITFIDAGVHCGLVSRQFILNTGFKGRAILVEPIPQHVAAIRKNLHPLSLPEYEIVEAALGSREGYLKIFKEANNSGNSSLIRNLVPAINSFEIDVRVISSEVFSESVTVKPDVILLKSDLQGFDAQVLAKFSTEFWSNLDSAVIEVIANLEIEPEDIDLILGRLAQLNYISWRPADKAIEDINEIREFWLSKNGMQRNLYISK